MPFVRHEILWASYGTLLKVYIAYTKLAPWKIFKGLYTQKFERANKSDTYNKLAY